MGSAGDYVPLNEVLKQMVDNGTSVIMCTHSDYMKKWTHVTKYLVSGMTSSQTLE